MRQGYTQVLAEMAQHNSSRWDNPTAPLQWPSNNN
jgi:hypothetical protein